MSKLVVHWRHEPFSHDAGYRSVEDSARMNSDAARTGILSDEHQEVTDDRPVLVEDITERVYRAADLPPDTVIRVADLQGPAPPIIQHAREAGFRVEPN